MKILAAGDIHGDMRLAEMLANKAEEADVDLVLLCGDLTQFEQSTDNIIGPFVKKNKKVAFVPGNHESEATANFLAELYNVENIHGKSIKHGDVGIFGCSGVNLGIHRLSDDESFEKFSSGHNDIKEMPKRIMVTHVHPSGSKMEKFTQFFAGSDAVRKAIDTFKPHLALCSHVHEAEGMEEMVGDTLLINVGKHGKIIDI